jgi:hypothetical protein
MDITSIILGVILLVVLYYLYVYVFKTNKLASKLDLATPQSPIVSTDIAVPETKRYAYELWIFVYKPESKTEYIFSRAGTTSGTKNIGLKLDLQSATLSVEYDKGTSQPQIVTTDFPYQAWTHIIVSVDNNYIDTYINGKLASSIKDSVKSPSATSSIEFGKLNAYIAGFYRYTEPIDPQTAWSKYSAGTGSNPFSKYLGNFGLDLSLKQDNKEYSKLSIF